MGMHYAQHGISSLTRDQAADAPCSRSVESYHWTTSEVQGKDTLFFFIIIGVNTVKEKEKPICHAPLFSWVNCAMS